MFVFSFTSSSTLYTIKSLTQSVGRQSFELAQFRDLQACWTLFLQMVRAGMSIREKEEVLAYVFGLGQASPREWLLSEVNCAQL